MRLRRAKPQPPADPFLATASDFERAVVERCLPHSITSPQRILAVVDAVRHVQRAGIAGAFAECGVWRGGSVLAMILALQELGATDRDLHLYDTFEGMTEPGPHDTSPLQRSAVEVWEEAQRAGERPWKEYFDPRSFDEEQVREFLLASGYPAERLHLVRGRVEDTLPAGAPERIALLRLDTDWYESTLHELEHLYPRLAPGGVLIVDDYGHWEGARRAVDEYFAEHPILLSRLDYTGRMGVKPA